MRGDKETLELFILATNSCNLSCRYCYETAKNRRMMQVEPIWRNLKRKIEEAEEHFAAVSVIFHGGEPLLAFASMRELCERIWRFRPGIVCQMTTNGTLLTGEVRAWLTANKHRFVAILSLDGDRDTHNLNRSESYDRIDRAFFRANYPEVEVKMTVAPNTLERLFENFKALRNEGFRVNPGLANEVEWVVERDLPIYAREMNKLIAYYLDHPQERPCKMLDMQIEQLAPNLRMTASKGCGAGVNIAAYDVEGNPYPCHSFIADLNKPYDGPQMEGISRRLATETGNELIPTCTSCPIYRCCSPCFGLNHSMRGRMDAIDPTMCSLMKVGVLATAKLYAEMLSRPDQYAVLANKSHDALCNLANAVRYVFREVDL